MTKMKKSLAMLLCMVMCLSLMPTWALAEDDIHLGEPAAELMQEAVQEIPDAEPELQAEETAAAEEPVMEAAAEEVVPEETPDTVERVAAEEAEVLPAVDQQDTEGTIAPMDTEAEEPTTEPKAQEPAEAAEGTAAVPVEIVFAVTPEEAELAVYTKDENDEKTEIDPEEDGSYRLLPGEYYYTLSAEGYAAIEEETLAVEPSEEPVKIEVTLMPVQPAEENVAEEAEAPDETEAFLANAAAYNPYPTTQDVDGDGNYEIPCTYVAWQQVYDNLGIALPAWEDGRTWANYARGSYPVVDYPVAPSIACWNSETENHVAFVTDVNGDQFWVTEGGRVDLDHTASHGYAERAEKRNSPTVSFIVLFDASTDHTKPKVTSGNIVFPREDGFWIRCSGQDDKYLKQLKVGVWHSGVSVDDAVWADAYVGNGKTQDIFVSTAPFNHQRNVTYYANVYAIDYNNNVSAAYSVPSRYFDSNPPRIVSATIENVTSIGYDVRCRATDDTGISHIRIGTWHDAMSIDNALWQQEPASSGSVVIHVDMKDFGYGQDVTYHTNVFAYDTSGNVSAAVRAGDPWIENNLPKITGTISNVTGSGFDVSCTATGFPAIARIQAGIWHDGISVDNAQWKEIAGDSGVFHISTADFGNPQNTVFHVNLFAFDTLSRRNQKVETLDVTMDTTPPVVTSASVKNITSEGYDVVCRATDNFAVAKIRIGTWHDAMSIDDAVWTEVESDGSETVIHVDMADFGYGQDVTFHTNVFAIDSNGNVSEAKRAGDPYIENNLPRVIDAHAASINNDGYDVVVSAKGFPAVSKIRVGTWHDQMSIDDARWLEINGSSGTVHIRYADFGDVRNVTYHSNVFVEDTMGRSSQSAYRAADVYHGSGSDDERKEFEDVADPAAYYYNAVYWAVDNGITAGKTATTFAPYDSCTRAQVMAFLYKAMGSPSVSGANPFTDVKESDYFYAPVLWAVSQGITSGTSATTFSPYSTCTRAQVMAFLYKAKGSPAVSGSNPFTDVKEGDYFYNAVQWAVANGITSGTSATTFAPYKTCTRAQVMTFLYKAMN